MTVGPMFSMHSYHILFGSSVEGCWFGMASLCYTLSHKHSFLPVCGSPGLKALGFGEHNLKSSSEMSGLSKYTQNPLKPSSDG